MVLGTASSAAAAPKGFEFGVSSGDVSASSAILWARANKAGTALLQLQTSRKFGPCELSSAPRKMLVKALPGNDLTVQAKVGGLQPGRTYKYRWCMEGG